MTFSRPSSSNEWGRSSEYVAQKEGRNEGRRDCNSTELFLPPSSPPTSSPSRVLLSIFVFSKSPPTASESGFCLPRNPGSSFRSESSMETGEKMPLLASPKGIAEAIDLPENHTFIKASSMVLKNRQVESDVSANEEDPITAHVAEVVTIPLEKPVTTHLEKPVTSHRENRRGKVTYSKSFSRLNMREADIAHLEKPVTAHRENRRGKVTYSKSFSRLNMRKADIDTASPIESVKEAVSRFGECVDWNALKAHRAQYFQQRCKSLGIELEISEEIAELRRQAESNGDKLQLPEDLYSTQKLIEELKETLERARREEDEATQASEIARMKVEELQQEFADEARHAAAISDLNSTIKELETLCKEYASMEIEKNIAVKMAEEAVAASKKVDQSLTCLSIELESLELARIAHPGPVDKDFCKWKLELQHAEEKLERLNQHVLAVKDFKSKLDAASSLLLDLKSELAAYMESKLKQEGDKERKMVLEEVKANIEKATAELNSVHTVIRQSEETASIASASLKAKLDKTRSQIASIQMKGKGAREKMIELPKKLEQAEQEANQAKLLAQAAQLELCEAKEEAEQAKARASAVESRLLAAQTELEDAKSSEKLVVEAIKALQESESAGNDNDMDSPSGVTLGLKEYYELRKQAYEAVKQANLGIATANSQIEMAKDSELHSLNKMEEVNQELAARRESLKMATEKAEKAQEGKLGVEHELRKLKAEYKQQRNASFEGKNESNSSDQTDVPSNKTVTQSAPETKAPETKAIETKSRKKKHFFPRLVKFFAKRKTLCNM